MAGKTKGTYKVRNWSTYNESLVQRASITLWFNEEALGQWLHTDPPSKREHPFVCSQIAITSLLVVRELFRLSGQNHFRVDSLWADCRKWLSAEPLVTLPRRATYWPTARY